MASYESKIDTDRESKESENLFNNYIINDLFYKLIIENNLPIDKEKFISYFNHNFNTDICDYGEDFLETQDLKGFNIYDHDIIGIKQPNNHIYCTTLIQENSYWKSSSFSTGLLCEKGNYEEFSIKRGKYLERLKKKEEDLEAINFFKFSIGFNFFPENNLQIFNSSLYYKKYIIVDTEINWYDVNVGASAYHNHPYVPSRDDEVLKSQWNKELKTHGDTVHLLIPCLETLSGIIINDDKNEHDFLKYEYTSYYEYSKLDLTSYKNLKYIFLNDYDNSFTSLEKIVLKDSKNLETINIKNFILIKEINFEGLENVKSIGDQFLKGCKSLEKIDFRGLENVESIGNEFLSECLNLEKIDFRGLENVKFIGDDFLFKCSSLKIINFTELKNVESIGDYFLFNCLSLEIINFIGLEKIKSINNLFLCGCKSLEKIDFKGLKNVESIGDEFLNGCESLKNIDFRGFENVKSIGNYFLSDCVSLETINFRGFENVKSIGNYFLSKCLNLTKIDFRGFENVKSIGNSFTFLDGCSRLKEVNIRVGVSSIIANIILLKYNKLLLNVKFTSDEVETLDDKGKNNNSIFDILKLKIKINI